MSAKAPIFVRNAHVDLTNIAVDENNNKTGWRSLDTEQIEKLYDRFMEGEFGKSVACGVQLLDAEIDGKILIDDGRSTISALLRCR